LWRDISPRFEEIEHIVDSDIAYGVMGNMDQEAGEFDYLAGLEVKSTEKIPSGMSSWQVPGQKYAIFSCTLPTLMKTFDHIYGSWLPESEYQRANGPEFELYDEKFNPKDESSVMHLYIPIR
jgi:AraC family transcriptional regulator